MRLRAFAVRNTKEMVRDKLNLAFGLGFPIILLLLLSLISSNVPVELFVIDKLTPGVAVFGLSFISLFSGMLIAKDRSSLFMLRLFTSPMTATDFILGYTIPLLPLALGQAVICFIVAMFLGLDFSLNILLTVVVIIPAAVVYIAIGLLCGSVFTEKQVGGICGALLTNLSAWLSGTWFSLDLVGETFKTIANALPFVHAVDAGRAALEGDYGSVFPDLWWVIGYAMVLTVAAIAVFKSKINSGDTSS